MGVPRTGIFPDVARHQGTPQQTRVGVAWALVQPWLTLLVLSLIFGRLHGFAPAGLPYPLFVLAGILPWTLFSTAVTNSANSLVSNAALLTKVYFPRLIIPATPVAASLGRFSQWLPFCLFPSSSTTAQVCVGLALPAVLLGLVLLSIGAGTLLSAWNVRYRDVRHAVPFIMQFWMFGSPVIYPSDLVSPHWRWLLSLNPLTGYIEGFRASLFGLPFPFLVIHMGCCGDCGFELVRAARLPSDRANVRGLCLTRIAHDATDSPSSKYPKGIPPWSGRACHI